MSRDRDVRIAVQTALIATQAFDAVYLFGLPEDHGSAASIQAECIIRPVSSAQNDFWDDAAAGGLVITSRVSLTLIYRHNDDQLRDEGAELLLDTAANALNGQSLADLTLVETTRVVSWDWQPEEKPERRIQAVLTYQYIVENWNAYDVTP